MFGNNRINNNRLKNNRTFGNSLVGESEEYTGLPPPKIPASVSRVESAIKELTYKKELLELKLEEVNNKSAYLDSEIVRLNIIARKLPKSRWDIERNNNQYQESIYAINELNRLNSENEALKNQSTSISSEIKSINKQISDIDEDYLITVKAAINKMKSDVVEKRDLIPMTTSKINEINELYRELGELKYDVGEEYLANEYPEANEYLTIMENVVDNLEMKIKEVNNNIENIKDISEFIITKKKDADALLSAASQKSQIIEKEKEDIKNVIKTLPPPEKVKEVLKRASVLSFKSKNKELDILLKRINELSKQGVNNFNNTHFKKVIVAAGTSIDPNFPLNYGIGDFRYEIENNVATVIPLARKILELNDPAYEKVIKPIKEAATEQISKEIKQQGLAEKTKELQIGEFILSQPYVPNFKVAPPTFTTTQTGDIGTPISKALRERLKPQVTNQEGEYEGDWKDIIDLFGDMKPIGTDAFSKREKDILLYRVEGKTLDEGVETIRKALKQKLEQNRKLNSMLIPYKTKDPVKSRIPYQNPDIVLNFEGEGRRRRGSRRKKGGDLGKALSSINNQSMPKQVYDMLQKYGGYHVFGVSIHRDPVQKFATDAINLISRGRFEELKNEIGLDNMFHVWMIVYLEDPKTLMREYLSLEKNQVVTIERVGTRSTSSAGSIVYDQRDVADKPLIDFFDAGIMALRIYLDQTHASTTNPWNYNPIDNNCQTFLTSMLRGNSLLTPEANEFLLQDTGYVVGRLDDVSKGIAQGAVSLAQFWQNLTE